MINYLEIKVYVTLINKSYHFMNLILFFSATKIEFYVGDVAEDIPVSLQNARYTRLGYAWFSF